MNKKVFIYQDGTIPGRRIIEELERRGAKWESWNYEEIDAVFFIDERATINFQCGECLDNYTELLYNKETDSFYENTGKDSQRMVEGKASSSCTAELILDGFYTGEDTVKYTIPEGYEATIEDGKVIVRKKKWQPKRGEFYYYIYFDDDKLVFKYSCSYTDCQDSDYNKQHIMDLENRIKSGNVFRYEKEVKDLCDKLNSSITPMLNERKEAEK